MHQNGANTKNGKKHNLSFYRLDSFSLALYGLFVFISTFKIGNYIKNY